jgi:hypothetical protein
MSELLFNDTTINATGIITNISEPSNSTIKLVMEIQNASISAKIENSDPIYNSAIFGVFIGATLTFLTTIIWSWINKKRELIEYEYKILQYTKSLAESQLNAELKTKIRSFTAIIYLEPKLCKVKSQNLIVNTLTKLLTEESVSEEGVQISNRINYLKESLWLRF